MNALRVHFRDWVMKGTPPPPSVWPRLKPGDAEDGDDDDDDHGDKGDNDDKGDRHDGHHKRQPDLVAANKAAMGFPTIPGLRPTAPEAGFINPVLDYDWGPEFDPNDASGVPTNVPPPIKHVIKMLVPRVDADGNEIGGVPVVLRDAPLGTYLGWNITAGGARPFHQDQICDYVGGMIPFAKTKAERLANGDPRLSLEERYKDHAGYVAAVQAAADNAVAQGFLLQPTTPTRWSPGGRERGSQSVAIRGQLQGACRPKVCTRLSLCALRVTRRARRRRGSRAPTSPASACMNRRSSSGVLPTGCAPWLKSCLRSSGAASVATSV